MFGMFQQKKNLVFILRVLRKDLNTCVRFNKVDYTSAVRKEHVSPVYPAKHLQRPVL